MLPKCAMKALILTSFLFLWLNTNTYAQGLLDEEAVRKALDTTRAELNLSINFNFGDKDIADQPQPTIAEKLKKAENNLKSKPNNIADLLVLAEDLKDSTKRILVQNKTAAILDSMYDANPNDFDCVLQKAKLLNIKKEYQAAVDWYAKAQNINPKRYEPYEAVGTLNFWFGYYEAAQSIFGQSLEMNPYSIPSLNLHAFSNLMTVVARVSENTNEFPDWDKTYINHVLEKGTPTQKSEAKMLNELMDLTSIFLQSFYNSTLNNIDFDNITLQKLFTLGTATKSRVNELETFFMEKLKQKKRSHQHAVAAHALAFTALLQHDSKKAVKFFRTAIALDKQSAMPYRNLAFYYASLERNLPQAIETMSLKVRELPEAEDYKILASISYKQKNYSAANDYADKGLAIGNLTDLHYLKGILALHKEEYDLATQHLLSTNKDGRELYALGLIAAKQKKWGEFEGYMEAAQAKEYEKASKVLTIYYQKR